MKCYAVCCISHDHFLLAFTYIVAQIPFSAKVFGFFFANRVKLIQCLVTIRNTTLQLIEQRHQQSSDNEVKMIAVFVI